MPATFSDDALPAPGQAFYYLVRGTNDCGAPPAGVASWGAALPAPSCSGAANQSWIMPPSTTSSVPTT